MKRSDTRLILTSLNELKLADLIYMRLTVIVKLLRLTLKGR